MVDLYKHAFNVIVKARHLVDNKHELFKVSIESYDGNSISLTKEYIENLQKIGNAYVKNSTSEEIGYLSVLYLLDKVVPH